MKRILILAIVATMVTLSFSISAFAQENYNAGYEKPTSEAVNKAKGVISSMFRGVTGNTLEGETLCKELQYNSSVITINKTFMKAVPALLLKNARKGDVEAQQLISQFIQYVKTYGSKDSKDLGKYWHKFWTMSFKFSFHTYKCNRKGLKLIKFMYDLDTYLKAKGRTKMVAEIAPIMKLIK